MTEKDSENVDSKIARHIGTFAESIQHKLDLIVEGQQMLSEKIDRSNTDLAQRIDCVKHKLDAVAAETQGNTDAIRGLNVRFDTLAAETRGNTEAIRGLNVRFDTLAEETRGNTEAIRGLDTRLDTIEIKLDSVAADLSAHRADTEAHRKVYKIKED
jgi:predicted  nucleic acid-binding Zn-ribbon protein